MTDMEQLTKLREKYNQLKQANKVLKEGLLEKQEGCSRLEQQLKEKDGTIRQQLEEIDHLQFQNGRVSKQLGTVTAQLEESKQRQPQQSGWSVGGLISGKQQQEAIQKATEEIRVLKDELMMKIQENEDLHMQIFETKRQWEEEQVRLEEEKSSAVAELEAKRTELDAERQKSGQLQRQVEEMERSIEQLRDESVASKVLTDSLRSTLEAERAQGRQHIKSLEAELARWVPFDEARFDSWNAWNLSSRHGREAGRHQQAVAQLQASILDVCSQSCNMLQMWTKTFGGGGDEESAKRLRVRTKMSDTVERLAKMIGERIPNLLGGIDLLQMLPTAAWALEFKADVATILQTHRKWVMYQSMLLLHDWNSSYASRSSQEEAQAQRFVEWLWRLHRRLRSLFSRMRVLSCVQGLSTSNQSATHFALARRAVKKRSAGTADFGEVALDGKSAPSSAAADVKVHASQRVAATDVAPRIVESLRKALQDVSQCWEGIGRCLSAWAMAQANPSSESSPQEGGSVVELLEAVHRFNACLADRVTPAMARIVGTQLPGSGGGGSSGSGGGLVTPPASSLSPPSPVSPLGIAGRPRQPCSYVGRAALRLARAPAALGFEEALQTQHLAQRLSATGARLSNEMRQQVRRLQVVTDEKAALAEELRVLQDDHALLRSNFQVLQDRGGAAAVPCASASSTAPPPQAPAAGAVGERPPLVGGGAGFELVLSSRQRALLESLSVTAQESAALRQHGFFVDVLSLSPGDVALASGAPEASSAEGPDASSWEVAVRRVYEQHARQLQSQIRAADCKAMELHLKVQQNMDLLREEESAKQGLRDEAQNTRAKLESVQEDMATTRKNYDNQLAMLTEHICTLSAKLSDKDSNLAGFQAQKVLCGRCGMWNTMGKLLATESWGTCQTCKEKVLSRS